MTKTGNKCKPLSITLLCVAAFAPLFVAAAPVKPVHVFLSQNGPHPPDAPTVSVDTTGAVGPKHLVGFINGGVTMRWKRDGSEARLYQTQRQFWEAALKNTGSEELPANPYDPRIEFDPLTSRWFALADVWRPATPTPGDGCCGRFILFGVSSDADPTHPWKALLFPTRVPVDNVKLGLDKNGVYTTEFGQNAGEPFKGALLAVPKADLLWKDSSKPSLAHLNRLEIETGTRLTDNKLQGVEGVIPAIDLDPKKRASDPEICVNRFRREVGGETIIQVRKITWTSTTQAAISEPTEVGLGAHYAVQPSRRAIQPALPEGMVTPGLNAGEGRLVNAVVRNGSVWSTAATDVNDHIGGFWFQIDVPTLKLVQHGTIADPQSDLLFPSLSVDAEGNVGIAVMRTSATEAASTYVTGRLRGDPPNTLQPLVRAVEGRYPYLNKNTDLTKPNQGAPTCDYANTVLDPTDRTLFWSNQFAATNNSLPQQENGGKYATHWVAFRVSPTKR